MKRIILIIVILGKVYGKKEKTFRQRLLLRMSASKTLTASKTLGKRFIKIRKQCAAALMRKHIFLQKKLTAPAIVTFCFCGNSELGARECLQGWRL